MERSVGLLLILLILPLMLSAQTFTSKTTGGHWNSASTWQEGSVPTENSNVVINGTVVISTQTCNNLTINSSGIIEDEPSAGRVLTIKGNLINNGTVRTGNGNAGVSLYVQGNVENYGSLISNTLRFSGTGQQRLLCTKRISVATIEKFPDGTIQAMSDLEIDSTTTVNLSSDILLMGTYKLTKLSRKDIDNSNQIFTGGTINSNGLLDIGGRFGSDLDGTFTLTGSTILLFVGSNTIKQNLTIGASKVIADEPSAGRTIFVTGNVINNGTVKNRFAGLWINVKGNVTNNGEYTANLRFEGDNNQTIGGTKIFSANIIDKYPNGTINAATDVIIDSVTTVTLSDDILNMGSYKLTKLSRKNIDNSSQIISGGTVFSNGLLDIGGRFGSDLDGAFTLTGSTPLLFTGSNVIKQNLTIGTGKTIADEPSGGRTIFVRGNVINEGTIANRFAGLWINVKGNFTNNGVYTAFLRFEGDDKQTISGSKIISAIIIDKFPNGTFNAASDIAIDSTTSVNLSDDVLNMGSYKLTKKSKKDIDNSNFIISSGKIISNGSLDISGRFGSHLDGDFILTGTTPLLFTGGNIIYKNLRVSKEKIIQDEPSGGRDITVSGDILNYGTISNRWAGLNIYSYGSVYNYGKLDINWIVQRSKNNILKLSGTINSNISLEKTTGSTANVEVDGLLKVGKRLVVNADVTLTLNNNSELNVYPTISNSGTIINNGKIQNRSYIFGSGQVDVIPTLKFAANVYDRALSDSAIVTIVNGSRHPKMASSINRWWSFQGNKKLNSYSVDLLYDDSILNGQDPNLLDAYLTTDNGISWKKISNPINMKRDLVNKKITVGTKDNPITFIGDIILSSGNVVNLPSISSAISGRKEVRVGPPNRYTLSYWNNNSYPTDKFFIKVNTNQGVYFDGIYTKKIGSDTPVLIPIDSLVYDNKKDELLILVQPLGSKEVRNFDVVVKAALGPTYKTMEPITLTAALLWIGGAIVEEYISNTVVAGCYEMWRPVRNDQSLTDASVKALKNSMNEAVTVENGVKGIAKKGAEEIIKKTAGAAIWPVSLAKDIYDCMGNAVKGMKDYVNGNFDKQDKELVKVTSWDPNAKEGPTGYGTDGFMATTAPMTYTIYFENKKEATAAAYEIVVLDTLDANVFDVNSLVFGATSHPNVKQTVTRTGNILKWDFVGIELAPNITPPIGEGWVKFTANLKPNLPTGTKIKNKAVITFDINKPIATNVAVNTLDFDSPTAAISSITKVAGKDEVSIAWSGNDGTGAGVKNAIVYSALGEGPYTASAVTDKSPVNVPVQKSSTYKFYMLATDNVGNSQKTPSKIFDVVTEIKKEMEIATDYSLEQNYPNPFNPKTTISFKLPQVGKVHLKVYDILGKEIITLVDKEMQPGKYSVEFNGKNLSSGIYFYKLQVNEFSDTKKLMLLK